VFQGGSIENVLYLTNGHVAISGSSSTNKLVICDMLKSLEVIQELTDHTGTITGFVEIDSKLISCGIDKSIVVYDI
jgi:hypothetical protein